MIPLQGDRSTLTARDPDDGSVQWEYELPEREGERGFFGPEVTQAGSLTMLTMDARQHVDLVALDREDGTEHWRYPLPENHPPIELVDDDVLVIADDRDTTALDMATGEERWRVGGQGDCTSSAPSPGGGKAGTSPGSTGSC